jgi:hypothetical protein
VAERARLESVCTGNRTAGSNPALSAIGGRAVRRERIGRSSCEAHLRGRARTRVGRVCGRSGVGRVWTRGSAGGRRDAGALALPTVCGWVGGGFPALRRTPVDDARNPALSAMVCRTVVPMRMATRTRERERGGWVRTRTEHDVGHAVVVCPGCPGDADRGKQGARVPRDGAPRTSSGPEGSSDKGNATGAAVPPGSLFAHAGMRQGKGRWVQGTGHLTAECPRCRVLGRRTEIPVSDCSLAGVSRRARFAVPCALCPAPRALGGGWA